MSSSTSSRRPRLVSVDVGIAVCETFMRHMLHAIDALPFVASCMRLQSRYVSIRAKSSTGCLRRDGQLYID